MPFGPLNTYLYQLSQFEESNVQLNKVGVRLVTGRGAGGNASRWNMLVLWVQKKRNDLSL